MKSPGNRRKSLLGSPGKKRKSIVGIASSNLDEKKDNESREMTFQIKIADGEIKKKNTINKDDTKYNTGNATTLNTSAK